MVFFDNYPNAWTPTIKCIENGQTIWTDYLPVDYRYKKDAIATAKSEIERLKEYGI